MKTWQECVNEARDTLSSEDYYNGIYQLGPKDAIARKAGRIYAREVAQKALVNASKNVKLLRGEESFIFGVDLNSITDPSNIQL